jgi:erythronate-4-phosphate dehydrogenase
MIRIVADENIPFLKGALEPVAQVEYLPGSQISNHHLKDAHALIVRTRTRCNEALLHGSPVKFIATATIGFDHIDTAFCLSRGIRWNNAPGCNANSVKQYIASALAYIISEKRARFGDLTLGIVGAGRIGSRVEVMARILGIRTLVNDPPRERQEGSRGFTPLDELLEQADIITMHVPLNPTGPDKTHHLADKAFFQKMKKGAWFINSSRGEVHHTPALLEALHTGKPGGAILDVWEEEPDINRDLLAAAAIATPHIAGYSADGKANGTAMSVQAVSRFFGLGLDCWRPKNIPPPHKPDIRLSCQNKSPEEVFAILSSETYNIMEDSNRLRQSPETFEAQREHYPNRRESLAYHVILEGATEPCAEMIYKLGFRKKA